MNPAVGVGTPPSRAVSSSGPQGIARSAALLLIAICAAAVCACEPSPEPTAVPTITPTAGPSATPSLSPTPTLTPTPTFPADAIVLAESLNLRAGPAVAHPIIGGVGDATPVAIRGRTHDGEWLAVRLPNDDKGWLSARFVTLRRNYDTIPTIPTPSPPPTPTFTPVPADPAQPIVLSPPIVAQGDPVLVRVRSPGTAQALVALGEASAALLPAGPDTYAGVIGVAVETPPGTHQLHVTLIDSGGAATSHTVDLEVRDGLFDEESIRFDEKAGRLLDPEIREAELALLNQVWSAVSPDRRWQGMWTPPITGTVSVSSRFGAYRHYDGLDSVARHAGMDFRGGVGRPVVAPTSGRVAFASPLEVRGNTVLLDHGWGIFSGYFHLEEILVEPEAEVAPGQLIGTVGATGMSTGPHLHFEVRAQGVPVQPLQWLIRDVGRVP